MVKSDAWRQFKTTRDVYCSLSERFAPAKWHPHILLCLSVCPSPEGRKKAAFLFFLLSPVPALLDVFGAGNLPSPTDPFAEVSHAEISHPEKRKPSGIALWKGPLWRVSGIQWGAIVPGLPRGTVDGNVIFKDQSVKITAFYSSDLFRSKLQAREIVFFPSLMICVWLQVLQHWCLSEHKPCLWHEGLILPSLTGLLEQKRQRRLKRDIFFLCLSFLTSLYHIIFSEEEDERQIENASTFPPILPPAFKHRKMQWEQIVPWVTFTKPFKAWEGKQATANATLRFRVSERREKSSARSCRSRSGRMRLFCRWGSPKYLQKRQGYIHMF